MALAALVVCLAGYGTLAGYLFSHNGKSDKRDVNGRPSDVEAIFGFQGPLTEQQSHDVMQGMRVDLLGDNRATFELAGKAPVNGTMTGQQVSLVSLTSMATLTGYLPRAHPSMASSTATSPQSSQITRWRAAGSRSTRAKPARSRRHASMR